MTSEMKALVYEGPRIMNIRRQPVPQPGPHEVLIRVVYTGICGSELSGYLGQNSLRKPPLVMGHEFSGLIERTGSEVSPELAVGMRVTVNPLISCYRCDYCLQGQQQLCRHRGLIGAKYPGSFAEFVVVPEQAVVPLPETMSMEDGALVEPLACAVRAAEQAEPSPNDTVLIVGMGPIGLFTLQALTIHGVRRIVAVDKNTARLRMAERLGAIPIDAGREDPVRFVHEMTYGRGATVTVDAVGAEITRMQCVRAVAPGGRVVFAGLHDGESKLPINDIIRSEIRVFGSFAYSASNFAEALQWLMEGRVTLNQWVVKEPLEKGAECFERLLNDPGDVAKILLVP
jgi:threonine dehydrogenase-like Zn-dependent dehydrogenase